MDHAAAIRTQIQELEAEVQRDPRQIAIGHLRAALLVLEGGSLSPVVHRNGRDFHVPVVHDGARPDRPRMLIPPREGSQIKQVYNAVGAYIDANGPTHRAELLKALQAIGLFSTRANPVTALTTSLNSLKEYFVSDGAGTFRRRDGAPTEFTISWSKKVQAHQVPPGHV